MSSLATLVANRSGRAETRYVAGREYLVARMVMLVPGVLSGSHGPLLYPADEVAKDVQRWNHVPITLGHPTDSHGRPITAYSEHVAPVGVVRDAAFRNGRLVADGWFAADALRRLSPRLLSDLKLGRTLEVSTGLYTDDERVANGVHVDGRRYTHVARNYRPDHLAVLLDQRGACSVSDGCGLNLNSNRRTAMRPAHDDFLHCPCTGCTNERGGARPRPLVTNCDEDDYDEDDYKPKPMALPAINWAEAKRELDAQQKVRRD